MALHDSAQIGRIIRNAVIFNPKNWEDGSMQSDSLLLKVQELFSILEQRKINYVLVGGIALLYYIEGRNTQDIDLLLSLPSLEKLPELQITSRELYFTRASFGELQIDLLLTTNRLFKQVFSHFSQKKHFLDRDIPLATVEGLILLKLYALPSLYRQGNFARVGLYENDIATLLHDYQPNLPALFKTLSKYVSETDLEEIQNILADIQKRIQRFRH